jgi:2-C-methyl-D-erythritol 4-phosphate cytidylyltransferase
VTVGAVLVAAGEGSRLRADLPKALVELEGTPLVVHALRRLRAAGIATIVVVGHPEHLAATSAAVGDLAGRVVAGGSTRSASVRHGLDALPDEVDVVAVHDAARALTPTDVIAAAVTAVAGDVVAAAPGLAVTDTLKRVTASGDVETVDRDGLVAIQTPQVVRRGVLEAAHVDAPDASDDLGLVERLVAEGRVTGRIVITGGSALAMKITYEQDLHVAAALLHLDAP